MSDDKSEYTAFKDALMKGMVRLGGEIAREVMAEEFMSEEQLDAAELARACGRIEAGIRWLRGSADLLERALALAAERSPGDEEQKRRQMVGVLFDRFKGQFCLGVMMLGGDRVEGT